MPTRQPMHDRDATEVIGLVGDTGDSHTPATHGAPKRKKKMSRRAKIILSCVLVPLILIGIGSIAAGLYLHNVEGNVQRVDAFAQVPEAGRPQKEAAAKDAMNFLLLGSDSRDPENTGGSRSDTIIVAAPATRTSRRPSSSPSRATPGCTSRGRPTASTETPTQRSTRRTPGVAFR